MQYVHVDDDDKTKKTYIHTYTHTHPYHQLPTVRHKNPLQGPTRRVLTTGGRAVSIQLGHAGDKVNDIPHQEGRRDDQSFLSQDPLVLEGGRRHGTWCDKLDRARHISHRHRHVDANLVQGTRGFVMLLLVLGLVGLGLEVVIVVDVVAAAAASSIIATTNITDILPCSQQGPDPQPLMCMRIVIIVMVIRCGRFGGSIPRAHLPTPTPTTTAAEGEHVLCGSTPVHVPLGWGATATTTTITTPKSSNIAA